MRQKLILTALSVLLVPMFAATNVQADEQTFYVVDSSGNSVMSAAGCVVSNSANNASVTGCAGEVIAAPVAAPVAAPAPMAAPTQNVKMR